jgi:hypothetical protein
MMEKGHCKPDLTDKHVQHCEFCIFLLTVSDADNLWEVEEMTSDQIVRNSQPERYRKPRPPRCPSSRKFSIAAYQAGTLASTRSFLNPTRLKERYPRPFEVMR